MDRLRSVRDTRYVPCASTSVAATRCSSGASAIPTYRASYETSPLPDGTVKMTVHVTQENVPDSFQAYVPVTVDLGQDRVLRTRVKVTGRETIVDLPPLPNQPKKFTFNDLEGVLAVVRK